MVQDIVRRRELAEFLRTRRERITPKDVGIVSIGARKLPGLRREEVADLAHLGLAWYTWLEQARDIKVSDEVLNSIANALKLNAVERAHLLTIGHSPRLHRQDTSEPIDVSDSQLAMLGALDPNPAHIRDEHWNVLAWNKAWAAITKIECLPPQDRNLLRIIFTDAPAMDRQVDWDEAAAFAVAQFRFECARRLEDPEVVALLEELRDVSPLFSKLWHRHEVDSGIGSVTRLKDELGELVLERSVYPVQSALNPALINGPRQRLSVYLPAPGTDTFERLRAKIGGA